MNRTVRTVAFVLLALLLAPFVVSGAAGLPAFGHYRGPYGDLVNADGVRLRHVTNMVSMVNYDVRGFDTLGEEFILLAAVTGVTMLLRGTRGEASDAKPGRIPHRRLEGRSPAVTGFGRCLAPLMLVFGIDVILHGPVTPGGGFQGGVIVFAAGLLVYFGEGYRSWRRIMRAPALGVIEAAGAALYALTGLASMLAGGAYLQNMLPLGRAGSLAAGGTIPIVNFGVGLAVAGGFAIAALEFLEETRIRRVGDS